MGSDAVTAIKNDHRRMEQLFERMRSEKSARAALLKECVARLSAHSWAEEERVYPALIKADPPEEGQVYHGVEEHHEAEELLHKLQQTDLSSAAFDSALEEFVAAVKHHVEEEETEILPALAESVDPARLRQLGDAFEERRLAVLAEHGITGLGRDEPNGSQASGEELSRDELYERAKRAEVPGRSKMSKDELARAVSGNK